MTKAKAYAALVGSIATGLLGVFTGDTAAGKILTVVAVAATAFATYRIPNQTGGAHKGEAESGQVNLLYVLWCVVLVLAALALIAFLT